MPTKRRKNGEGSWGEKLIKGVKYKYYRTQYNGKDKYFYGKTEKEIKAKITAFEEGLVFITPTEVKKTTFGDYIMNWLKNIKQTEIKRRTYDGYEDVIKSQLVEFKDYNINDKQMGSINQEMFQLYYNTLAKTYSRASIRKNYIIVKQCLEYAKESGDIKENFLDKVKLPAEDHVAVKKKDIQFLPEDDMEKLYQESKRVNIKGFNFGGKIGEPVYGHNAYALVLVMYTGLRISELLGLQWGDIDLENKFLHVNRNLSTIKRRR